MVVVSSAHELMCSPNACDRDSSEPAARARSRGAGLQDRFAIAVQAEGPQDEWLAARARRAGVRPCHCEQQNVSSPVGDAVPVGSPPADAQLPGSSTGAEKSLNGSPPVKVWQAVGTPNGNIGAVHVSGSYRKPGEAAANEHEAPAGAAHVHGVHPRWSSTPV